MADGWIKIYRGILDWEWYSDLNTRVLFIHCLLRANWDDEKWKGIVIPRGSFVSSLGHLAKETGLSVQNVRTSLTRLKLTQEVTSKSHGKYSVFTITNYDKYQATNTMANNKLTSNQQATNNNIRTKEYKNNNIPIDLYMRPQPVERTLNGRKIRLKGGCTMEEYMRQQNG